MKWPPLIDSGHLPPWIVARDVAVTLLAWCLLLYFIREMMEMAAYWLLLPFGIELLAPWQPGDMWRDTLPFLKLVALAIVWLVGFAVARWQLLTNRRRAASQPMPLDPQRQAEAFGVSVDALSSLQGASSATIDGTDGAPGRGVAPVFTHLRGRPSRKQRTNDGGK